MSGGGVGAPVTVISNVNVSVSASAASASVTVYVYGVDDIADVGVPVIVRARASNVSPAGNAGEMLYVSGRLPPVANGSCRLTVPFTPYVWSGTLSNPKSGVRSRGVPLLSDGVKLPVRALLYVVASIVYVPAARAVSSIREFRVPPKSSFRDSSLPSSDAVTVVPAAPASSCR